MIVIKDPKTFCLNFDWPKFVDQNLKHEIELILRSNEASAQNKIRNKIGQLLLKYKHGNNIQEQKKTAKRVNHINLF